MEPKIEKHHHHILPTKVALAIGVTLLFLTGITVWIAGVDLGSLNFLIAMAVATSKALLVALFFMNLKYDRKENGVIFATSFVFLAIFIVLTSTDMFFRGDIAVKGPLMAATKSKIKKPWIATPESVSHGKELFQQQCVACHGEKGQGNGPAAAALNPHPRNFTSAEGWTKGRKPTQVFDTLTKGVPGTGMASFATLPSDDRWALAHYVLSLGPTPPADTPADFAKIGIDPTKESGGPAEAPTIPVNVAMDRMAVEELAQEPAQAMEVLPGRQTVAATLFQNNCASCHGSKGQGGIKVKALGVNPVAYVTTAPFKKQNERVSSFDKFSDVVINGLPGDIMPGHGELTTSELKELHEFVKAAAR